MRAMDGIHYIEKDATSELDVSSMQEPQHKSIMEVIEAIFLFSDVSSATNI